MRRFKAYQVYINKAIADLRASMVLLKEETKDNDIICFHLQQFVEKYLKAYLISKSIQPDRTHNINKLVKLCADIDLDFDIYNNSIISELTDCAVLIRYDDDDEIDDDFIEQLIPLIDEFKIFVENNIDVN